MLSIMSGVVVTAFSVFSLWGGTSVPLGALMAAAGIGMTVFGVIRMVREASGEHTSSGVATSPHRSD